MLRTTTERQRLESIQRHTDSCTTAVLEGLSPQPSWNCLELGAGAGSIAYWLAQRCPRGRVVAADLDTRLLDPDRAPNLVVEQTDLTKPDYAPGHFDLIHARYLFCHLPARDELLARAADWLAPGGWLVIEDPYQLPAETSPFPPVRRLMAAYARLYDARGADLTWARSLPALLARNGLTEVDYSANPARMGAGPQDRWAPLIRQAAPELLARGLVTQDELDAFEGLLADPSFIDIPQVTIAAWGRRAG
ncbi:class I SAM-dependent methyltransferase [Streptomyces orinoci]|uniref:Methyltransferase domain-containing protein n=1 Tax=Streptomyces orinoci TaxID=67339 RepID=A0ABV3JSJ7_STRON|nr:class I SAM-dependent methyltransferase [Streptomyces orinoci]